MRPAIHINHPPGARAASGEHKYALGFREFVEQQSIRRVKLPRTSRRYAPGMGIILLLVGAASFVERFGPRLKGHFADLQVGRQIHAVLAGEAARARVPISSLS